MEIFRGMGKNFKVCRYTIYLFKSYKQIKCTRSIYYTLLLLFTIIGSIYKALSRNLLNRKFCDSEYSGRLAGIIYIYIYIYIYTHIYIAISALYSKAVKEKNHGYQPFNRISTFRQLPIFIGNLTFPFANFWKVHFLFK